MNINNILDVGWTHNRERDTVLKSPNQKLNLIGGGRTHEYKKHTRPVVQRCGTNTSTHMIEQLGFHISAA